MAIGKVNAYATVEGTPTDFGKMTVDAIDKYNAEEQKREAVKAAKEAAAAKAREERVKESKVTLDKFEPITGQNGISELISKDISEKANHIYEVQQKVINEGLDSSVLNNLVQAYNQTVTEWKTVGDGAKEKFQDISKNRDKYDPNSLQNINEQANDVLGGNWIPSKDSEGRRVYQKVEKDSKGNVVKVLDEVKTPADIMANWHPIPKFDVATDVNNFTTKISPLNKIAEINGLTKVTRETLDKSPTVDYDVASYVKSVLSDNDKLVALNAQRPGGKFTLNPTQQDVDATAKWYSKTLKDGYKEIIDVSEYGVGAARLARDKAKEPPKATILSTPAKILTLNPETKKEEHTGYAIAIKNHKIDMGGGISRSLMKIGFDGRKGDYLEYVDRGVETQTTKEGLVSTSIKKKKVKRLYFKGDKTEADKMLSTVVNPETGETFVDADEAAIYLSNKVSEFSKKEKSSSRKNTETAKKTIQFNADGSIKQ